MISHIGMTGFQFLPKYRNITESKALFHRFLIFQDQIRISIVNNLIALLIVQYKVSKKTNKLIRMPQDFLKTYLRILQSKILINKDLKVL